MKYIYIYLCICINSVTKEYNLIETIYDVEPLYNCAKEKDPLISYNYNILKR